jgi:hypothetical protein
MRIATIARASSQQPSRVVAALASTRGERQVLSRTHARAHESGQGDDFHHMFTKQFQRFNKKHLNESFRFHYQ